VGSTGKDLRMRANDPNIIASGDPSSLALLRMTCRERLVTAKHTLFIKSEARDLGVGRK